jgi:two-component system sensor histidine kinase DegS
VSVEVKMTPDEVLLIVQDNGRGFDSSREEERGIGLATMYERARMLNGSLALRSQPGGGTCVTLRVPRAAVTVQHAN